MSESTVKERRPRVWTPKGTLLFVAYIFGLFYLIVPVLLQTPFYGAVILMPLPADEKAYAELDGVVGGPHEEFYMGNGHGDKLHAMLWRVPGAQKVMIFHHGNAGNLSYRSAAAAALRAMKTSVFLYDYRAYGKSSGKMSLQGVMDDGLVAFDFVNQKLGYAARDIINYGESLGAGPACRASSQRDAGGLLLQSGISSLPTVGRDHFVFLRPYPDFFFPQPHMDNISTIKDVHCPVVIINGEKDTTIPVHLAQLVFKNANEPKKLYLMPESSHNAVEGDDIHTYIAGIKQIIEWSTKYGGSERAPAVAAKQQ